MRGLKFSKLVATGNDFIIIKGEEERNWSSLSKAICHRKFGVGADGLLVILPSSIALFKIRIFNPDGSEAEVSGNGLMCCAKYAIERGLAPPQTLKIETKAGIKEVLPIIEEGKVLQAQVKMGPPRFLFDIKPVFEYPLVLEGNNLSLNFVSMGNPHCVCFIKEAVEDFPLSYIGPKIESYPLFPQRTNFEVANILGRREVRARVWERGVGETLSCGSGACAIVAVAYIQGYVDKEVDVLFPGGKLKVIWGADGYLYLQGNIVEVFSGEWEL